MPTRAPKPRRTLPALLLVVTCVTIADLCLKRGAVQAHASQDNSLLTTLGIAALASRFTLIGILFHLAGLAAWLYTLRSVPLTIAYCFTAVQQATIALGAWLWLGEIISPLRWIGIATLMTGVVVLVPSIIFAENVTDHPPPADPPHAPADQPVAHATPP
jgi:multidrug transporter EmrE-like cation transporter